MAAVATFAIPELLRNVLSCLAVPDLDEDDSNIASQDLFPCLFVNKLWYHITQEFIWAHIPEISCLTTLPPPRAQFYANRARSLLIGLSNSPLFNYEFPRSQTDAENDKIALRQLRFPVLQKLYLVVDIESFFFPHNLDFLPQGGHSIHLEFKDEEQGISHNVYRIQKYRLRWEELGEHSLEAGTPRNTFNRALEAKVRQFLEKLHDRGTLTELVIGYAPPSAVVPLWEYVSKRPELKSLITAFPKNFPTHSWRMDVDLPSRLHAIIDLSHLVHLRVENCPAPVLPTMFRSTRNLETLWLSILLVRYGARDDDQEYEEYLDVLLDCLAQNTKLRKIDFDSSSLGTLDPWTTLAIREERLLAISRSCKDLREFAIEMGIEGEFDLTDRGLIEFARNLPEMEKFILHGLTPHISVDWLRVLSQNWPKLKVLGLLKCFDFSELDTTAPPLWPGRLESLHIGYPIPEEFRLRKSVLKSEAEVWSPAKKEKWSQALHHHFPGLVTIGFALGSYRYNWETVRKSYYMPLSLTALEEIFLPREEDMDSSEEEEEEEEEEEDDDEEDEEEDEEEDDDDDEEEDDDDDEEEEEDMSESSSQRTHELSNAERLPDFIDFTDSEESE